MAKKPDPNTNKPDNFAPLKEHIDLIVSGGKAEERPIDDDSDDLMLGSLVASKYEVLAVVGRGGMGSVYKAQHVALKRTVAIKVLHKHLISHPGISERFRQSAQAAHTLRHPNLASVTDFGFTEMGEFYLAMDYIEGETLANRIRRERELSVDTFFKIFSQVLTALRFCHQKGIVHRDIKPSNILLTDKNIKPDSVKLVDFGIAKVLPESESSIEHLTQTGELLGSPLYMSPEQCRGDEIDARTDLYSLGCVMFEALTGKPPFQGKSAIETLMMQCADAPPTLPEGTSEDSHLNEQLDAFIKKALTKKRDERFSSSEEMEDALASIQRFLQLPKVARHRLTSPAQPSNTILPPRQSNPSWAWVLNILLAGWLVCFIAIYNNQNQLPQSQVSPKDDAMDALKLGIVEREEGNLNASQLRLNKALPKILTAFGTNSQEYLTVLDELGATELALAERSTAQQLKEEFYTLADKHFRDAWKGCLNLKTTNSAYNKGLKMVEVKSVFHLARLTTEQLSYAAAKPLFEHGYRLVSKYPVSDERYLPFFKQYANFLWHTEREFDAAKMELRFELEDNEIKRLLKDESSDLSFSGLWTTPHFSLKLTEEQGQVTGSHRATIHHRIDGDLVTKSLNGSTKDGIFSGWVTSTSVGQAQVAIVRIGDYLVWKLLSEPTKDAGMPDVAVLKFEPETQTP